MKNRHNSTESTDGLTPRQAEVITALVRGSSVTDATRQVNVDRTTFYLWRKDAFFEAELNRAKQEQIDAMRAQLWDLTDVALATVRECLINADMPAAVRLKAALAILQNIGALQQEQIGSTDPSAIRKSRDLEFTNVFDGFL
jgi:hypothetical protein